MSAESFYSFPHIGLALDPIHVGTGGSRLGRVDNTIVRDAVTLVPKIPGSSLAGVLRTYAAMASDKYPRCAGQGQSNEKGHCGEANCPICTVFGFARGSNGGFAGLAGFSDARVLFFPVATREGPMWITSPDALRSVAGLEALTKVNENVIYRSDASTNPLNLGWIITPTKARDSKMENIESKFNTLPLPPYLLEKWALVSDKLYSHVVNNNLEVRTSVSINPQTGAAEDGALYTYEALPRGTVFLWHVTCRNPKHFRLQGSPISAVNTTNDVHAVVLKGSAYLEYLGIGGMGTRGMGRLRVLSKGSQEITEEVVAAS